MAELDPETLRITASYQEQTDAVRQRLEDVTRTTWANLPDYNEETIQRWIVTILAILTGGQIVTAALTDRYLAAVGTAIAGVTVHPEGIPRAVYDIEAMRGVPADDVYRRPAQTVWREQKDGKALEVAVAAGLIRALQLVATDLQLTKTHSARYVGDRSALIVGYRRVLSGGPCSLCSSKNTRFSTHELMPIHTHCRCSMMPIYARHGDPGPIEVKPVDDRGAAVVHQHGEVGPMLTARGDAFAPPR